MNSVVRLVLACACLALAPGSVQAASLFVAKPVTVDGATPPGCGVPEGAQPGAEVEPHLAVDPADPSRIALAWQQDRNRTGGATALGLQTSADGGRTWAPEQVPGLTGCPLAEGNRASDPWVSYGAGGRLWLASVPGTPGRIGPLPGTRVAVATQAGPGAPWGSPTFADARLAFNDKETLTADPRLPGTAYAVWTLDASDGYFARTTDAGATWSAPLRIANGSGPKPSLGLVLHVAAGGDLVAIFGSGPLEDRAKVTRSSDGGATWSTPRALPGGGGRDGLPEPRGMRSSPFLPQVGANGDHLVVAIPETPRKRVRYTESRDAGRTWSPARTVVRGRGTPFMPSAAVHTGGAVGVTTYHLLPGRRAEVWFRFRPTRRSGWRSRRLARFSIAEAPRAGTDRFLGDYTGLVPTPGGFVAGYAVAGPLASGGRSSIAVTRIRLPG